MALDPALVIPANLLPKDGRFGSGPSKVPAERLAKLAATGVSPMGTSHRQAPVKELVRRIRVGLTDLFALPEGHEVALGTGGSALVWNMAAYSLVRERSQHTYFGRFGQTFADEVAKAPWLKDPSLRVAEPGDLVLPEAQEDVDVYAWTHNETSTGVSAPVLRPAGATADQLTVVDATSAAGGIDFDASQADVYYFAPQKSFASDGGLWIAALSPAAVSRAEELSASGRYVPAILDLAVAVKNSRADQTLNTPAVATLWLMAEQIDWMLENGGLAGMEARSRAASDKVYAWAERADHATPFVPVAEHRSPVVATIEIDPAFPVKELSAVLRANGIVDVDAYRGIGTNQLRIGTYPAVDASDAEALTACIDYLIA